MQSLRSCGTCLIGRKHGPNKRAVGGHQRIMKLIQKGHFAQNVAKYVGCPRSAGFENWSKYKEKGKVLKREHTTQDDVQG